MAVNPHTLPVLRDELEILEGAPNSDGSPTWTIFDPIRNRFFKLDRAVFEVLTRWRFGNENMISSRINQETSLNITPDYVKKVATFLSEHQLTRSHGRQGMCTLAKAVKSQNQSWWAWLMHHYLFFRIPVVRPDCFLSHTYPYVAWLYSRFVAVLLAVGLVIGLFLLSRQWETFVVSLVDMLSLQGLVYFGVAIVISKLAHEFGHAYTAKRFGCHVPTMGIAFLVMWPMFYTDCNETWKLKDRRQRFSVASAGMVVELSIAIFAMLLWSFLPYGPAKDMTFVLATTTWVSSVLINISPFMRFDGYYLMSDWLDIPNLHERSTALARWKLREVLFDLGEPAPEIFSRRRRRFLITFAVCVWVYRLVLFLGIAMLVYHFFIKIIGVLLFSVEIGWFVLRPLWSEMRQWGRRRGKIMRRSRSLLSLFFGVGLVVLFSIPWQATVTVPALLQADSLIQIYASAQGRIVSDLAIEGRMLMSDEPIMTLENKELDHQFNQLNARRKVLQYELDAGAFDAQFRKRNDVIIASLAELDAEREAFQKLKQRLKTRTPMKGIFTDPEPDLTKGQWIGRGQRLGAVRSVVASRIVAYVDEDDIFRIKPMAKCRFYSREPGKLAEPCHVEVLQTSASAILAEPALASAFGGTIRVRAGEKGLVPERAIYKVRLKLENDANTFPTQIVGRVRIEAEKVSVLTRVWTWALAVLIRESGM